MTDRFIRTMDINQLIFEIEDILNQAKTKLEIIKKAQNDLNASSALSTLSVLSNQLKYDLDLNSDNLKNSCDLAEEKAFKDLLAHLRNFLEDEINFGRDY